MGRLLVYVGLLIGGIYAAAAVLGPRPRPHPCSHPSACPDSGPAAGRRVLVIAHRGGSGLGPESTLPLFRESVDLGVDMLEMDVHRTADGALVVYHDDRVDRTTDGTGRIDSLTLAQIRALDAGYRWRPPGGGHPWRGRGLRIPTVQEVLDAFPRTRLLVEIKSHGASSGPAAAQSLCRAIRRYGAQDRVIVASFATAPLRAFRRACPRVATSGSRGEVTRYTLLHLLRLANLYLPPFDVFQVPERVGPLRLVDARFVRSAHARGLPVQVWTVNDRAQMEHLVDLGVDGIITDRPDVLLQILRRRGMR